MNSIRFIQSVRLVLLYFFLSLIDLTLTAQPCFERVFGGQLNEEAALVRPTFDHGYILIGSRDDTVFNKRAYYVLKLDSLGNEQWSRSYGDGYHQRGSSIVQTVDSGYAFVGSHEAALYNAVAEVVRIGPNGNLLNSKTYPPSDGWATQGIGIIATADSNLAISSYTDGFISQNYYSLNKLNPDLSINWSNFVSFDGSLMNEHDAVQGPAGNFFTLGHYPNFYYTSPPILNVTEVRQMNSNGILLIDTLYTWNTVSNSISPTREGGSVICGDRDTLGNKNISITLLDSLGAVVWQKELGGSRNESGRHSRQTLDGGFVILASVPHTYFPLLNDIVLMKVSAHGDSLWTRTFGATFDDVAVHMQETYDGGFIILGKTNSFDSAHVYLIKTDSLGVINAPYKINGPGNYFCKGDSVVLKLDPMPPPGSTVLWSTLETTDSIQVATSANFTATVTDSLGNTYQTPNYFLFFATITDARLSATDTLGICTGAKLENLAASGLSFSYTWFLDDTLLPSVRTNFLRPTRTGKYTLRVDNYCGSDADTVILDSIYSLPVAPVMNFSGNKFICVGDSLQLNIPNANLSYQWWYAPTGNAVPVSGATDTMFMARTEGIYFVQAADNHSCKSTSNPLNIFFDNYPAYVNTSGPISFCQGGHVILSAPNGSNYLWNTGDTTSFIFINSAGDFWFSMTSMFGCPKTSDTVLTEVYLKPYINLGPDTTVCNTGSFLVDAGPGYSSYLWQDGSSNPTFLAFTTSSGIDSALCFVEVTDVNACSNRDSVLIHFDICQDIGRSSNNEDKILIPALVIRDQNLSIQNYNSEETEILVFSITGQKILKKRIEYGRSLLTLPTISAGVYFYSLQSQGLTLKTGKLLVQ
jgi:hypothetical protein